MAQFFNFKGDYFGLTDDEVENRADLYGYNIYTKNEKKRDGFSVLKMVLSPNVILMLLAGVLCFFGGGVGSGVAIIVIDALYVGAEVWFGRASDERLAGLRESTEMKYRVIRSGKPVLVPREMIVNDDLIAVQSGERVPADAFILESRDLTADEYVLTGAHDAVAKYAGAISKAELHPDFLYSGTSVLSGTAICKVSAIGVDTKLYQKYGERPDDHAYYTSLEKTVRSIVPFCCAVGGCIALVSLIIWLVTGGEVVPSALRGITLGLCFIPAGMSTVIRMNYMRCADELLSGNAMVRSLSDIEKLNSLSVLCVEKEGAVSRTAPEVRGIYAENEELLFKTAVLAIEQNTADPCEKAFLLRAAFFDENIADICRAGKQLEKLPDSSEVLSGALWSIGGAKLYCIKGAPERILTLCRMKGGALYAAQKKYADYYAQGCRVIAFACADASQGDVDSTAGFCYTLSGFAAFAAPLRDNAAAAVATCRRAGVRVVMMTDDTPAAAAATGRMIGLGGTPITSKQVEAAMNSEGGTVPDSDVCSKLTAREKLWIMSQLKAQGEVTAFAATRAGDVEMLEAADIGVTISQHSSGSALEAADIIMNDDDLSSIADAIAMARQAHRNIKRAVSAMISGYTALIILNMFNLFGGAKLMLNPALVCAATLLLIPACALCYLGGRSDMGKSMPPSAYVTSRRINLPFIGNAALIGVLTGAVAVASYMFMYNGANTDFARSCALISFAVATAVFGLSQLSRTNPLGALVSTGKTAALPLAGIIVLSLVMVYVPGLNAACGLTAVDALAVFISVVTGLLPPLVYFFVRHFISFR